VQSLVYSFIVVAGFAIGAAAYFGLTFSPIEAFLTGLGFVAIAVAVVERTLRQRSEARLERAIEELSRLLSTNAQAGIALGQRIDTLADDNAGRRLDVIEADISVLGTVVRQVAEAVADLEGARKRDVRTATAGTPPPKVASSEVAAERGPASQPAEPARSFAMPATDGPVIPLETLKQAIDEGRLVFHLQPIVTLPLRKTCGYDLVPRLALEEGEFADPPDFMPKRGGEAVIRRIERLALEEAVAIARRARAGAEAILLHVGISRATLADAVAIETNVALLEANQAVTSRLRLMLAEAAWSGLPLSERAALAAFTGKGVKLALGNCRSLRLDFARLAGGGVAAVRIDAAGFLEAPERFTDFHSADVAPYVQRFGIELVAGGITNEEQVLIFLEDGVRLAQGPHIGGPGPAPAELAGERGGRRVRSGAGG
jgi:cyclic-di-GMP phosphodiesterase TipF (flagellum assembly factor)